jgi:hypothetical protein
MATRNVRSASAQARRICVKNEGAEAPAGSGRYVPRLLPATDPRPSCEGKATVELMTVRLAELVNASEEPTG